MKLTLQDAQHMLLWASIFATGWWITLDSQQELLESYVWQDGVLPTLLHPSDVNPESLVATVYGLWPAWSVDQQVALQANKALQHVQGVYDTELSGIFPVETWIEMLAIPLCGSLDIPLIDADVVWGRAVPELKYDNFLLWWISVFPLIAVDVDLHIHVFGEQPLQQVEQSLRSLVTQTWASLVVMDHICTAATLMYYGSVWVLSRNMNVWQQIQQWDTLQLMQDIGGEVIATGRVTQVDVQESWWFLVWEIRIFDEYDNDWIIDVQNEYMSVRSKNQVIASFPDLISLVDTDTFIGASSSQLFVWQYVQITKIPCEQRWENYRYIT